MPFIQQGSTVQIQSGYRKGHVGCVGSVKFSPTAHTLTMDNFFVLVGVVFDDGEVEVYTGHQVKLYTKAEASMDADLASLAGV